MNKNNFPIGIFDSGIGGLILVNKIKKILPNENIIYFGDTDHLPYGDKSASAIQSYSIKICNFLLSKKCKIIIIACNSASSHGYDLVKEYIGKKAIVINVIDPVIEYMNDNFKNGKIGIIGTKATISSKIYEKKIKKLNKFDSSSLATPLLAHLIEEGFYQNNISQEVIKEYLEKKELNHINHLILGCTHYPLIKKEIDSFYNHKINTIDYSDIVAEYTKKILTSNNLENIPNKKTDLFFVSDLTKSFEESTKIFFGKKVKLKLQKLD